MRGCSLPPTQGPASPGYSAPPANSLCPWKSARTSGQEDHLNPRRWNDTRGFGGPSEARTALATTLAQRETDVAFF
jgi:hypothetical protein